MAVKYTDFNQTQSNQAPAVEVKDYYDEEMLRVLRNNTVLYGFAKKKELPSGNSDTIRWLRNNTLDTFGELVEMEPPVGQNPTEDSVIANVKQYGDIVKVSDKVQLTYRNDQLRRWQKELQQAAWQTKDLLAEAELTSATTQWAFDSSTDDTPGVDTTWDGTTMTDIDSAVNKNGLDTVVQELMNRKVPKITNISRGSRNINSSGIFSGYVLIAPTQAFSTIKSLDGFLGVQDYPQDNVAKWKNEIGAFTDIGLRVVLSDNLQLTTDSAGTGSSDAYPYIFMGEDAFGTVKITGGSLKNYIHPVTENDKSDPLGQMGIVGVKFWDAYTILNQDCIIVVQGLLS